LGSREKLNVTLVEPSRWWKSASTSPATLPAGGDIPHAGTVRTSNSPPPDITAALTAAGRGGPADA